MLSVAANTCNIEEDEKKVNMDEEEVEYYAIGSYNEAWFVRLLACGLGHIEGECVRMLNNMEIIRLILIAGDFEMEVHTVH